MDELFFYALRLMYVVTAAGMVVVAALRIRRRSDPVHGMMLFGAVAAAFGVVLGEVCAWCRIESLYLWRTSEGTHAVGALVFVCALVAAELRRHLELPPARR